MSNDMMGLMQYLEAECPWELRNVAESLPQEGKLQGEVAKWVPIIFSPAAYQMSTHQA